MKWYERRAGTIPVNHVQRSPKRLVTFHAGHVKTKGDKGGKEGVYEFRCVAARIWTKRDDCWVAGSGLESTSLIEFWQWLHDNLRRKEATWSVCYNVAWQWTLLDGWNALCDGQWQLGPCVMEDAPVIIRAARPEGRLRLLDLRNYWTSPLPELMASVGIHDGITPTVCSTPECWMQWCDDRAKAVGALMMKFTDLWDREQHGNFGSTAASCAWASFRHKFYEVPIECHVNEAATKLERDSYRGGMSDCYFVGSTEERIWKLDLNSAYPWALLTRKYPVKLRRYDEDEWAGRCRIRGDPQNSVADVSIETDEIPMPCLWEGRYVEALGNFRTQLAGSELASAVRLRLVRRMYRIAEYDVADLFGAYVHHWYGHKKTAREEGDLALAEIAKVMLCALYGKFAQRFSVWDRDTSKPRERPFEYWSRVNGETNETTVFRSLAWRVERLAGVKEWTYSFPAISAMVTAHVRERMRCLRSIAGQGHVYAQGSDSLYVDAVGFRNLASANTIRPYALGDLKVEHVHEGLEVKGPGSLWHGSQRHVNGLQVDAEPLPDGCYLQCANQGIRSILAGTTLDAVQVKSTMFKPSKPYDKGIVTASGWTRPFVLKNGKAVEVVA